MTPAQIGEAQRLAREWKPNGSTASASPGKLRSTNAITVPHVQVMVGASIGEVTGTRNIPMIEVYE